MIRVKLHRIKGDFSFHHSNLLAYIINSYGLMIVDDDPDMIISSVEEEPDLIFSQYTNKKILFVFSENLHYFQELRGKRIFYKINKKLAVSYYFNSFRKGLNKLQKNYIMRPKLTKYLETIKNSNNKFAIITNDFKHKNFLNFPFFLHYTFDHLEDFVEIKKLYRRKKKFCTFVVRDDALNPLRSHFCKLLSRYKQVDCYGLVLHNKEIPKYLVEKYLETPTDLTEEEAQKVSYTGKLNDENTLNGYALNRELFRDYKFVICFENSIANDYITEKLPNVMLANSIGIYQGAPNIGDYFNTDAFINFDAYGNFQKMIDAVIELDQDDEKYNAMLDQPFFKHNQIPDTLKNKKHELATFLDKVFDKNS